MSVAALPETVRTLFPREQLDFASSITSDENPVLKEVFTKYASFNECGEMIDVLSKKHPELGKRLNTVLEGNQRRIVGLSPTATDFATRIISMVTHTLCSMTLGNPIDTNEAKKLHGDFQNLSAADQAALKKNNPDITF